MIVGELAAHCYGSEPITAVQGEQLIGALAAAVPEDSPVDELMQSAFDDLAPTPAGTNWSRALAAAKLILTPEQMATFQTLVQLHQATEH